MTDSPNPDRRPQAIICPDMEERAELYNEGYQDAMKHRMGGDESRAWLVQVAEQIIAQWVDTAYRITLCGEAELHPGAERMRHLHLAEPWLPACKIADAVLSEINFDEAPDV